MLKDANYDKVKLLHELSRLAWFIQKHATENSQKSNDATYKTVLEALDKDIAKSIEALSKITCK